MLPAEWIGGDNKWGNSSCSSSNAADLWTLFFFFDFFSYDNTNNVYTSANPARERKNIDKAPLRNLAPAV